MLLESIISIELDDNISPTNIGRKSNEIGIYRGR